MTSDPTLLRWYRGFNQKWFDGKLRSDVILYWDAIEPPDGDERGLDGECSDEIIPEKIVIRINTAFAGWENQAKIVLAHEMAHLAIWPNEKHGAEFDAEIKRLCGYKSFRKLI